VQLATRHVPRFAETMPSRYRQLFRGSTVQEHEAIVARRGRAPAYAQIWRRLPQGGAIVCVVADDRRGLFSSVGMALATRSLDLLAAQIYCRSTPGGAEVVDLLWLRRDEAIAPSIVDADVARIADFLGGLMNGELRADGRPLAPRSTSPELATLVHYDESDPASGVAALILETVERPGLFRAVIDSLVATGAQIRSSRRAHGAGRRVVHRFALTEGDGSRLDPYRRGLVQAEVLRVVELVADRALDARAKAPSQVVTARDGGLSAVDGIIIDEANPIFLQ
jgi:UTP:GlnB (protein PII) uridylyltransferase